MIDLVPGKWVGITADYEEVVYGYVLPFVGKHGTPMVMYEWASEPGRAYSVGELDEQLEMWQRGKGEPAVDNDYHVCLIADSLDELKALPMPEPPTAPGSEAEALPAPERGMRVEIRYAHSVEWIPAIVIDDGEGGFPLMVLPEGNPRHHFIEWSHEYVRIPEE